MAADNLETPEITESNHEIYVMLHDELHEAVRILRKFERIADSLAPQLQAVRAPAAAWLAGRKARKDVNGQGQT